MLQVLGDIDDAGEIMNRLMSLPALKQRATGIETAGTELLPRKAARGTKYGRKQSSLRQETVDKTVKFLVYTLL